LLWRPHPLLEGTIKSMRPWLEQEYAEIVNEYKNGGYGIYDDSQDLNRAVALSDMYYGDASSVTNLFEAAGKAVLWQAFGDMHYSCGIFDYGNYVYFMDYMNLLYKYDKKSKNTEYMGIITMQNNSAYFDIAENNKKLYFAPYYRNNKITFFDIYKSKFEQINCKEDCKYNYNFVYVVSFKNFIYFIPAEFPAIMRLNVDTGEITCFSEWVNKVSKLQVSKLQEAWKDIIFLGYCAVDTELALVIHGANAIMFFNMETGDYEVKSIGEKSEQYSNICFDGENYYISSFYKDYIIKLNRQSNKIFKIKIPNFSRKEIVGTSFQIKYLNGHIWLLPVWANNAYKINVNTNEITELPELTEHLDKSLDWYYNFVSASENVIYASTLNKGIVEYNTNTSELSFIKPSGTEMETMLPYYISNCKNKLNETTTKTETAGKVIYETLRASLKTSP